MIGVDDLIYMRKLLASIVLWLNSARKLWSACWARSVKSILVITMESYLLRSILSASEVVNIVDIFLCFCLYCSHPKHLLSVY